MKNPLVLTILIYTQIAVLQITIFMLMIDVFLLNITTIPQSIVSLHAIITKSIPMEFYTVIMQVILYQNVTV